MAKIYDFEELVAPVVKALKAAYGLRRKPLADIKWEGPELEQYCYSMPPAERLTAENLRYSQEDQGRSALEEIIGIAVALGIQQGRNIAEHEHKVIELIHQAKLLIATKEKENG
jgi:hypothetical protein